MALQERLCSKRFVRYDWHNGRVALIKLFLSPGLRHGSISWREEPGFSPFPFYENSVRHRLSMIGNAEVCCGRVVLSYPFTKHGRPHCLLLLNLLYLKPRREFFESLIAHWFLCGPFLC